MPPKNEVHHHKVYDHRQQPNVSPPSNSCRTAAVWWWWGWGVTTLQPLTFALLFPDALALRRRHHDGDDREETHFMPRDQSSPAAREEPVQAGQYAHPAQLEEEAATAILCPAHRQRTEHHGVLGHGHLGGMKAQAALTLTPPLCSISKVAFCLFLCLFFDWLCGEDAMTAENSWVFLFLFFPCVYFYVT